MGSGPHGSDPWGSSPRRINPLGTVVAIRDW